MASKQAAQKIVQEAAKTIVKETSHVAAKEAGKAGQETIKAAAKETQPLSWGQYFCSTHFWGPVMNWTIPLAAIYDFKKDPEIISPRMTGTLMMYSALFMRWAWVVKPRNMLLFACHFTNEAAQTVQMSRYLKYRSALEAKAEETKPAAKLITTPATLKPGAEA